MASTRKPVSAITEARVSEQEETTLNVLFNLDNEKPEALGFGLAEVAEAGLPGFSPKDREGAYRLIVETADSLVEKGLAECSSTTEPAQNARWKITSTGKELLTLALAISASSKVLVGDFGLS